MSNSLDNIIKQIEVSEAAADVNVEEGDPRSRVGRETLKKQAEVELARLTKEYAEEVLKRAIFIAPLGSAEAQAEFARIAEEEGGTLTVAADELYRRVADKVYPSWGGDLTRTFTGTQEMLALEVVQEVMQALEIASLPTIHFASNISFADKEMLVDYLRHFIRKAVGDELNKLYIAKKLAALALIRRYNASVVPVVLTGITEKEVDGFNNEKPAWRTFDTKADKVNSKTVLKALESIKNKLAQK